MLRVNMRLYSPYNGERKAVRNVNSSNYSPCIRKQSGCSISQKAESRKFERVQPRDTATS